ncbi:bifunctional DNA primase/polymerase [Mycobacterium sp. 5-140-3-2]|nr:bifunctional DNA primase/polymerase [Mycobacterium sp. 5-140-3-2]WRU83589.1 bifunctional DNA primase/polymerase [Mycobacterium sp. 5-140-3-2]
MNANPDFMAWIDSLAPRVPEIPDGATTRDVAVILAEHGWEVFPLNGKVPAIRGGRGVLDATTDPAQIDAWWGQYRDANVGVRVPEDMLVLDVDGPNRRPHPGRGLEALAHVEAEHGPLPTTLTQITGSGGLHLIFKHPGGKLSKVGLPSGLEYKDHGGYIVGAQSIHPDTGERYTLCPHEIVDMPAWLAEMITAPVRRNTEAASITHLPTTYTGESVIDKYNADHSWTNVLGPQGWTCRSADPDADGAVWLHPTHTSDCSATIRDGSLYVYSSNTPFDQTSAGDPRGYDKFDAYTLLHYGGDKSAAAKALRPPTDYGHTDFGHGPIHDAEAQDGNEPIRYTDFGALLAGGLPEPPKPSVLHRTDGIAIFYHGKRNELYGDPEDGKTMVLLAAAAKELTKPVGRVLFLDFDNNGAAETAQRLIMLGVDKAVLADRDRFRHIEPLDADEVLQVVSDCAGWATLVGGDCVGELMPLFRANSDNADDYTRVMQMVSAPLERGGAAVIWLDHQAKGSESRAYGAGGTMAKRRAVSGVSINLVRKQTFAPGKGGMAELWVNKDRPGGLRAHCPKGEGRRQFAGTFTLDQPDRETGVAEWRVTADRAEAPAAVIDPVTERHYQAAQKIAAAGGAVTMRAVGASAHGLPPDTPLTEAQKKATQRALAQLQAEGRLMLASGVRPKRWEVAA